MRKPYLGEDLVFLISQPRSGSTLLQRVLYGHPEIQTSAETWLMLHPLYASKPHRLTAEYDAKNALKGVNDFLANYTSGPGIYDDAIRAWAKVIYGDALRCSGKKYFLDKTPRYFFIIPDLYRLFPKAKFIFLIRNPLAVLSSLLSTYVKEEWTVLSYFRHDLLLAPGLMLEGIDLVGEDAITVRYEEFVSDPGRNTESLCNRLGVSFHMEMLDYSRTEQPRGDLNDPVGVHLHSRPSTTSLEKWKRLADSPQASHFAEGYLNLLGRNVVESLGYDFAELRSAISGAGGKNEAGNLFPLHLALKPKDEWNYREWMTAERYKKIRAKGRPRGELSAIKQGILRGVRLLKHQLDKGAAFQ